MRLESAKTNAEIIRENAKANSDAIIQKAQANQKLLTENYLTLKKYEYMMANSKMIFGQIPSNVFLNGGVDDDDNTKRKANIVSSSE